MKTLAYSLRYLLKRRGNVATRLVSLSLGLAVALLIFSYVGFNLTYDRFFPDGDRIYRVYTRSPQFGINGKMVRPLGENMKADMPQIEAAVAMISSRVWFESGENRFDVTRYSAGGDFFDVLDFGVVSGDPRRVLSDEGGGSVMISERMARRLFRDGDPLGKTLMIQGQTPVTVAGVFRTPPANNSLGVFDMVDYLPSNDMWLGQDSYPTYIKLAEGADISEVENGMEAFEKRHGIWESNREWETTPMFVPLHDSCFVDNSLKQTQYILSLVGLMALVAACFNYVLVAISSLSERSRTVAMLRCWGAQRTDIFSMLLWETLVMVAAAVAMAAFVIFCFGNEIESLLGYGVAELFALRRIWIPLAVCLAAFLISGLIPAAVFSSVDLQYAFRRGNDNRRWWKRSLLFVQIACAAAVLLFLGICGRQFDYVRYVDYGYEHDNVAVTSASGKMSTLLALRDALLALPEVEEAGMSRDSHPIWGYSGQPARADNGDLLFGCRWEAWNEGYAPALGMKVVSGRNLLDTDGRYSVLVNEMYVEKRGWTADEAIGRQIYDGDGPFEIVGVIGDFMQAGGTVQPLVCHSIRYCYADTGDERRVNFAIRLHEFTPEAAERVHDTVVSFLGEDATNDIRPYGALIDEMFVGERYVRNSMALVCAVTLVIVLTGLVGYVDNEMQRRRKEIALRKVNGATAGDVMRMLAGGMACLSLPAVAAGVAVAIWGGERYLSSSLLRCDVPWWLCAAAAAAVLAVIYGVQTMRAWRTACANPIDMIKSE